MHGQTPVLWPSGFSPQVKNVLTLPRNRRRTETQSSKRVAFWMVWTCVSATSSPIIIVITIIISIISSLFSMSILLFFIHTSWNILKDMRTLTATMFWQSWSCQMYLCWVSSHRSWLEELWMKLVLFLPTSGYVLFPNISKITKESWISMAQFLNLWYTLVN